MNGATPPAAGLGAWSAAAVAGLGAIYLVVLAIGLGFAPDGQPIGDPWFTAMEGLILLIAPAMVAMTAALHAEAAPPARPISALALAFMTSAATLTCAVHFSILTLARTPEFTGPEWASVFGFQWPSLAYTLDILAWDFFFPLALFGLLPALPDRRVRRLFLLAAVLSLIGLLGPMMDMRIRNVGVLGYAVVFPIAAAILSAARFKVSELP